MKSRISFDNSIMTVQLFGEIDHHSARCIREQTDRLIQQKKPRELRLDLSSVSFMDSSGIGLIMGRYRLMGLYGGRLKTVNVPRELEKLMLLSGLGALDIIDNERQEMTDDNYQ